MLTDHHVAVSVTRLPLTQPDSEKLPTVPHVLIVDDNDDIAALIHCTLTLEGCSCKSVPSGGSVQALLARELPNLIIMDLMLPDTDGYHIIEQLQRDERTSTIPVIVMTARAEEMYRHMSADMGVLYHLTKPFQLAELVTQVQTILQM